MNRTNVLAKLTASEKMAVNMTSLIEIAERYGLGDDELSPLRERLARAERDIEGWKKELERIDSALATAPHVGKCPSGCPGFWDAVCLQHSPEVES